jgi:MFS family permease
MIVALVILLAGSIAEIASQKWQDWLGAAVLIRFGVGLAQTILVTYIAELAPFQIRGMLIGAYQVLLTTGQLIVAIAAELVRVNQPNEWRVLIGIEFLFTGVRLVSSDCSQSLTPIQVSCILIYFIPESHIFYARRDEHEKAKQSMMQLYGNVSGYDVVGHPHILPANVAERKPGLGIPRCAAKYPSGTTIDPRSYRLLFLPRDFPRSKLAPNIGRYCWNL